MSYTANIKQIVITITTKANDLPSLRALTQAEVEGCEVNMQGCGKQHPISTFLYHINL